MKASPEQQKALLELQGVDSQLSRLRHRMAAQPLAKQVKNLHDQLTDIRRDLVKVQTNGDDLQRAVNRSEDELERVRKRLQRDRELVDQGASARVQRELEHELGSLTRRISDLEDAELEMLSQQEELTAKVAQLQQAETELAAQLEQSRSEEASQSADSEREWAVLSERRALLAARVEEALLKRYEGIRSDTPVAVAVLSGNQCGGCRLELPPLELASLLAAADDEVLTCDECGCLLVRS